MIILLHGPDTFRARQKLAEIVESYKKARKGTVGLRYCDTFEDLQTELDQQALFNDKKLLVAKGLFQEEDFKKKTQKLLKDLSKSEHLVVFFEEVEIKIKLGEIKTQKFDFLTGSSLRNWVKKEFEMYGAKPGPQAVEKLIELAGSDSWRLSNEVKKLSAYKKDPDVQDIELLVSPKIETDIFKTIDAVGAKNKKQALQLLRKHIRKGDSPLYLLSMINYQFRNLLLVKSPAAGKLKLHPFVLRKSAEQARLFSFEELKRIYRKILEVDLSIKTGKLEPDAALELLVAEI